MEILKKLAIVVLTVVASTVLVRLILQWLYQHGQPLFSVENIGFGLAFPVVLVLLERKHSMTSLIWKSVAFVILITVSDFMVVHYDLDWPGMMW